MKTISNKLVESLKTLGLTEYEAKVYSALVLFERTEVKQVYEFLDAPKPSVYQSLKTLTDKGLVQVVNAKPAIYRAIPPKIALKHMTDVHKKAEEAALQELEGLEKDRVEHAIPDVLWTLYGDKNVEYSIEELMGKAKKSLRLILPDRYQKYLELLRNRDLDLELIIYGDDPALVKRYGLKHARVHNAKKLDLTDFRPIMKYIARIPIQGDQATNFLLVSVDDIEFMYIPPIPGDTRSGIATKNPLVLSLANMMFDAVWEHTPAV